MRFPCCLRLVAFGLTLFAVAGCHHPYGPNGYYPPGGYPSNFQYGQPQYGQPQYLPQPGGYPAPGSVTVPGDNTIYTPPAGTPFPADSPVIDNTTPGFGPDGYRSSDYGENNDVPRPRDTTTFESDREPFGELGTGADAIASAEYKAPRVVNPPPQTARMGSASDYSWLRGIVNVNPRDRSYEITYSLTGNDTHGGTMALAPHASLENIKNGDVVQVNGMVGSRNAFGAPQYQISTLQKLTPTN